MKLTEADQEALIEDVQNGDQAEWVERFIPAHLAALAQDERVRERWRNAAGVSYYADAAVAAFLAAVEEGP